jgi:hypothetical protein
MGDTMPSLLLGHLLQDLSAPAAADEAGGGWHSRDLAAAAAGTPAHAPPPEAAAEAAAGPVRGLDLQQTFKALATRPPPAALRFAAVLTDGGCDGMKSGDLTYWADHAFQPNHWSPHCRSVAFPTLKRREGGG